MRGTDMGDVLDRFFRRTLCASLLAWVALLLAPAIAPAIVVLNVAPTVPNNVTVGQTAVPMSLVIANQSTEPGGFSGDTVQIDTITFVPSCGSPVSSADCPDGSLDAGVIVPSLTGAGRAGTACGTHTFSFAVSDAAQGKYSITTNTPPLTLGPSGGTVAQRRCVIDFTGSVLRMPTMDSRPAPGIQTDQKSGVTGTDTGVNLGQTGSAVDTSPVTVNRATPAIATTASAGITLGAGSLTDTATVSGLVSAVDGATVEFRLYGPDDATCAAAIFTSAGRPLALTGTSGTATSSAFTPTASGTYRWRAFYSGDANNAPVSGGCNDPGENVVVSAPGTPPTGATPPTEVTPSSGTPPAVTPTSGTTPSGAPSCGGRKATIAAPAGQTTINGTPGADVIVGRDAAETINGGGGDDVICAGKGNDTVRGGAGNDSIGGEAGRDNLFGNAGSDLMLGGSGNDDLRGGAGNDRTGGGSGQDRVDGGAGNDLLDEQKLGGAGNDRLFGSLGKDRIRTAGGGADRIDCGSGPSRDSVRMDRLDRQQRCELVCRVKT